MTKAVILDSNLLVLLVVGSTDRRYIRAHKRLDRYDEIDFENLLAMLHSYSDIILTQSVLTETSNLLRQSNDPMKSQIAATFARLVLDGRELVVSSHIAVRRAEYIRLGFTDAAMLELSTSGAMILTADLGLYLAALKAGSSATNFTHVQERRADFK